MLSPGERDEIRQEVYRDLVEIEEDVRRRAGTYRYLCLFEGELLFAHHPVGRIVREIS